MAKINDQIGIKGTVYVISRSKGLLWTNDNMIVDGGLALIADAINPDTPGTFTPSKMWVSNNSSELQTSDTAHDFCNMSLHERHEIEINMIYKAGRKVYYVGDAGAFGNFEWKRIGLLTTNDELIGQTAYTTTKTSDIDIDVVYVLEVKRATA